MSEARKCSQCGARPTNVEAVYCEFCATELPQREVAKVQVIGRHGDLDARFAALEKHADLPRLFEHTPSATRTGLGMAGTVVFGGIFTVFSLIITVGFGAVAGPFALFPLLFVAFGIFMMVKGASDSATFANAPLQRTLSLVVDERTKVSGGGEDSSASTTYFATLEDKDGERVEYQVHSNIAGDVAPGDLGVAYTKANHMLDFKRVSV